MFLIFIVVLQSPAENFSFTQFNKFSRDLKGIFYLQISTKSTKLYYYVINQVILYWPSKRSSYLYVGPYEIN